MILILIKFSNFKIDHIREIQGIIQSKTQFNISKILFNK